MNGSERNENVLYSESQHVHFVCFTYKSIQGYASQIEESQDIQLTHLHFPICHGFSFNSQRKTPVMTYQNLLKYSLL